MTIRRTTCPKESQQKSLSERHRIQMLTGKCMAESAQRPGELQDAKNKRPKSQDGESSVNY